MLDTETSTETTCALPGFDPERWGRGAQRLLFGRMHVYRAEHRAGESTFTPVVELLAYADDLPESGMVALSAAFHAQGVRRYGDKRMMESPGWRVSADGRVQTFIMDAPASLVSRAQMVGYLLKCTREHGERCLIVGYNLPFDLSRLAVDWRYVGRNAEERYRGGFSFALFTRSDGRPSGQHPRIEIKPLQKGALMRWSRYKTGVRGQKPTTELPVANFLDTSTLVWALTGHTYSLGRACATPEQPGPFGVLYYRKSATGDEGHGVITVPYVRYNRDDVVATAELTIRGLAQYQRFGLSERPRRLYSAASLTKTLFRDLGVTARLDQQPRFWHGWHGAAMESFSGGRTECRLRGCVIPVCQFDFFSMYPTIWELMGIWELMTCERIEMRNVTAEVRRLVEWITPDDLFTPETWRQLRVLCLVEPNGARLPVSSEFRDGDAPTNGVLPDHTPDARWVTLPDVLAAKLLGGPAPHILRAVRAVGVGVQATLRTGRVLGIEIDPRERSPITQLVEERARLKRGDGEYAALAADEREARATGLKILVNAAYGVSIELNPDSPPTPGSEPKPKRVTLWTNTKPREAQTTKPERPGSYSFPLIGTLTTSGARLMLALLDGDIQQRGGASCAMDTDSAFVVCTQDGGEIEIQAADARGRPIPQTIRALSHDEVDAIQARFTALNPYDRAAIPGSILKIESIKDYTGRAVQDVQFYGLAAKAYALFTRDANGVFRCTEKFSEFGLGAYRDPYYDPSPEARNDSGRWKREFWEALANGDPVGRLPFADYFALRQTVLSTPHVAQLFEAMPWMQPLSFALTATPDSGTVVTRDDDDAGAVILPFESDPEIWRALPVYARKTGEFLGRICTPEEAPLGHDWTRDGGREPRTPIRTLGDVLRAYALRFNRIWLGPDGDACTSRTRGGLTHRPVMGIGYRYRGKASEAWELRDDGLLTLDETQTVYDVIERSRTIRHYPEALMVLGSAPDWRAALVETRLAVGRGITKQKWSKWRLLTDIPELRLQKSVINDAVGLVLQP